MSLYANLLEGVQMRDEQSVTDLLLQFEPAIKNLSSTLHYEEAKTDLIIVFLELVNGIDIQRFRAANNKQIASYIHKHLKNRALNLLRKHKATCKLYAKLDVELDLDRLVEPNTPDMESRIFISELFKSLAPRQREALVRKVVYGFFDNEIAEQLGGITKRAANRLIIRALRNLRKKLTEDESATVEKQTPGVNPRKSTKAGNRPHRAHYLRKGM